MTISPELSGWYAIFVCIGAYANWGAVNSHINLCLTRDGAPSNFSPACGGQDMLEESFWKCADMTGQSVTISKFGGEPLEDAILAWLRFVPLTEDGRLSAKDIMGNKKKLTWWQDEFWKHMVKKFPDLERGESASLTGRDHIPPRVFKEMTRLTKQRDKLGQLLTGITPFNAKSRAEEICKILDAYIPSVEKMDTLLRKYGVAFTKTASENKKLKTKNAELEESLASAQKVSTLKQIEDLKLRRDYDSAVAILEQIPAEVLNIYAQSSHRGKERPIEQSL